VLLYAHGTSLQKSYDMADIANNTERAWRPPCSRPRASSWSRPTTPATPARRWAYHAYLDRVQEAADMIDALRAARSASAAIGARDSSKLMVTGYSQGGYVALATQRAMQESRQQRIHVTAAAACRARMRSLRFGDELFGGAPRDGATVIVPMIINAGQHAGAAIYTHTSRRLRGQYAATIDRPGAGTLGRASWSARAGCRPRAVRGRFLAAGRRAIPSISAPTT
jgi:predicted dienelactone hydrolase